VKQLYKH